MSQSEPLIGLDHDQIEIIAFRLQGQEFCVKTKTIREIRGWLPSTPVPQSPREMLGVMNLRGVVIPIIDLASKLGMTSIVPSERSAIVVAEIHTIVVGLLVDQVSDILTVKGSQIQQIPEVATSFDRSFSDGIITHDNGLICFLNLSRMFQADGAASYAA
ncbi:chemotaxis signal transduction protein CheW 4 (plasmid) [Rhizobium gallicum bv. gallicum R602sp]|uniref:Chemotaxis signal transduction protein CheW 4 n=1 Tax=Rhizobium gallicum bv. gallicum R602sp TaxID=1041138 RepID=A0A0B4XCV4_9HYPH|nr:chemotaxis protein CheW [Rhizobium gallicum]AJD44605.1 chemotaxis signal transduction protein CheW 4 [Rhizobium gallicum bv. gallicum R602sp]